MEERIYKIKAEYEERALAGTNKGVIKGDAIRFNEWSEVLYTEDGVAFREKIDPAAWDTADTSECLAVFNHDEDYLLGTSQAGTLRFLPYENGVNVEIDKADTTISRDVSEWVKRGEIKGMSFKFTIAEGGKSDTFNQDIGIWERTITKFGKIYDVCPVTRPAYPTTNVEGRSIVVATSFVVMIDEEKEDEAPELEPEEDSKTEEMGCSPKLRNELIYNYYLRKHKRRV